MDEGQEPRRNQRVELNGEIDLRRTGDHRYRVKIMDLSPSGCRVESPVRVKVDDIIFVTLPGIEAIPAQVRWVKEWVAGVQFEKALHPSVFDMLSKRIPNSK